MGNTFSRHHSVALRRNERERLLFIAAAGLAFSLLIIMLVVLNFKQNVEATQASVPSVQPVPMGTVTLYVPEQEVNKGTKLADIKFKEVFWPRHQVPTNAITDLSEIRDMYAKGSLSASVPVQRTMLSAVPVSDYVLEVCEGCRAVTIEVDRSSAVEGHAEAGTFVDVVLTYPENGQYTSKILVERARVLSKGGETAVGANSRGARGGRTTAEPTVTLEVLAKDALAIKTATQMGKLSLLLRDAGTTKAPPTVEVTSSDLRGDREHVKPTGGRCTKGNAKIGDVEYVVGCDGRLDRVEQTN